MTMRVDVHQHVWTTPLLDALAARDAPPMVRRHDGLTVLYSAGEQPYLIDTAAETPSRRALLVRDDGLDLALIALSSPLGIEALASENALALIDSHLRGVESLPQEFGIWGPVALDGADPDQIDALIARRCVGVSLPAGALAGPKELERVGVLLERVAAHGAPLFVHPGPAPGQVHAHTPLAEPLWWRALTDYVAQMQAAWLTFMTFARREHPELVAVFALLAGCAPLLTERLATRGGPPIELDDPRVFYETSSYGPVAVEMMARRVGQSRLLFGSDRPVIDPSPSRHDELLQRNGASVFAPLDAVA